MRYFLVTFSLSDKFSLGTVCFEHDGFFSYDHLMGLVKKTYPYIQSVVIVNIFEFKSEHDYTTYRGEIKMSELAEYVYQIKGYLMKTYMMNVEDVRFVNENSCKPYYDKGISGMDCLTDLMKRRFTNEG